MRSPRAGRGRRSVAVDGADLNLDLALLDVVDRLIELDDSAVQPTANDCPHAPWIDGSRPRSCRPPGTQRVPPAFGSPASLRALPRDPASSGIGLHISRFSRSNATSRESVRTSRPGEPAGRNGAVAERCPLPSLFACRRDSPPRSGQAAFFEHARPGRGVLAETTSGGRSRTAPSSAGGGVLTSSRRARLPPRRLRTTCRRSRRATPGCRRRPGSSRRRSESSRPRGFRRACCSSRR